MQKARVGRTFQTNIHENELRDTQILTKEFQCRYMREQTEEHTLMCFKSEILSVDINSWYTPQLIYTD